MLVEQVVEELIKDVHELHKDKTCIYMNVQSNLSNKWKDTWNVEIDSRKGEF